MRITKKVAAVPIIIAAMLALLAYLPAAQSPTYQVYPACNPYNAIYTCPPGDTMSSIGICQAQGSTTPSGIVLSTPGVECYPASVASECGTLPPSIAQSISVSEPWYCPINEQIYMEWQPYLPLVLLVVLLSFSIAALIIMVGIAAHSERIKNFGVGEAYEAVASAIIVALFLYVCAAMMGVAPGIILGGINPYATAFNLIGSTISNAEGVINAMANVYMHDAEYTSFIVSISIENTNLGVVQTLLNTYYAYVTVYFMDPALNIAGLLSDGILALYAQYYLIVFFSIASIPVFLIPGVIFRAFFPTRAFGGMLIAVAMGFYIVAPSMFAVAYYFTAPNLLHTLAGIAAQTTRFGGSASVQNSLSPSSPLVLEVSQAGSAMSSLWLLILFYPVLITSVTYAFIVQVANFIGGASKMSGRMRGFI
ncbi:MAG: hypothetical protein QXW10_01360 [Candidatus Micrarchaeaceae archaeon]